MTQTEPKNDALEVLHVNALQVNAESSLDYVANMIGTIESAVKRLREIESDFKKQLVEWIEANGPLTINETKYYVGDRKDTKCLDVPATLQSLLEVTGGDFGKLCKCLASGAIKHGAAKRLLTEQQYEALFKTESMPVLKEGVPVKQVQKINLAFVK